MSSALPNLHYITVYWVNENSSVCFNCIPLPSGVKLGMTKCRIMPGGSMLEVAIDWPNVLQEVRLLYWKRLKHSTTKPAQLSSYHPMINGFESALRDYRRKATNAIGSPCQISLSKAVQEHIFKCTFLRWIDDFSRVHYVHLKAPAENDANILVYEEFELS